MNIGEVRSRARTAHNHETRLASTGVRTRRARRRQQKQIHYTAPPVVALTGEQLIITARTLRANSELFHSKNIRRQSTHITALSPTADRRSI